MRDPSKSASRSSAGRLYQVILGLSLACIGGLFVWLMARSYLRAREMHAWPEVPCVILSSEIEQRVHDAHSAPEFRHALIFGYEWGGTARTGDHVTWRGGRWSSKRNLVESRAKDFPARSETTCRVDPANPNFAVLKPDSLAPGYSIWFPGLFVIGGLGISIGALLPGKSPPGSGRRA